MQERERERFAAARVARLATVTADGRPHVVPVCFVLAGEVIYSAVDAKPKSTSALRRLDNVRANPRVSLLVDHYADDWTQLWWIRVDGEASIVDDEAAIDLLAAKYEQYRAARPPGPVIAVGELQWRQWSASPIL